MFHAKYSPCVGAKAKRARANVELAILPLGAFHSSLQTADGETPLHPGTALCPPATAQVLLVALPG